MAKSAADQPDRSRFIQDVTIRNFKCFDELKLEGCGQFNLILGDNNVGKTSVLEALLMTEDERDTVAYLARIRESKYGDPMSNPVQEATPLAGLIQLFVNQKSSQSGFSVEQKRINEKSSVKLHLQELDFRQLTTVLRSALLQEGSTADKAIVYHIGSRAKVVAIDRPAYNLSFPMILTAHSYDASLVDRFSESIALSTEQQSLFAESLASFIPEIVRVEIAIDRQIGPQLVVRLRHQDLARPLAMFGDGTVKLARILLEIPGAENDRLMIDEIDAGIHYSRFATLWRTTLLAAIANNVQLFITTHNVECLRALRQVLETEEFAPYRDECRSFTLERLPSGSIKAYRYDYEQFGFAIDNDLELRGRDL